MTTRMLTFALGAVLALGLEGCAHGSIDRRIDEKLAHEDQVNTRGDLSVEAGKLIQDTPGLDDAQRAQLNDVRAQTASRIADLTRQSIRLRGLLIEDVVAQEYDPAEVEAIKRRLRSIEDKRLTAILEAVDQANEILGRQNLQRQRILNALMQQGTVR
jgi:hypothetical protein